MNSVNVNGTTHDAAAELRDVVNRAEELLQSIADDGGSAADELRSRVNQTVESAKLRLTELDGRTRQAAANARAVADEYVSDHPWTAVAVAAAVAALAGAVLSRRG